MLADAPVPVHALLLSRGRAQLTKRFALFSAAAAFSFAFSAAAIFSAGAAAVFFAAAAVLFAVRAALFFAGASAFFFATAAPSSLPPPPRLVSTSVRRG